MYLYSASSKKKIGTMHPDLQAILYDAIEIMNLTAVWGYRGELDQNIAFDKGNSKLRFPESDHNRMPSKAGDVIPYPEGWKASREQFMFMQGILRGIAHKRGIRLKPLINWDLAHFGLAD